MEATELTVMLAAIGGFALQELINIRKGIKGNPNSPSKFKLGYYLTQ